MEIIQTPSENYNERADNVAPSLIIIHYTGTRTAEEASAYYLNKFVDKVAGKISPHYMIDHDGCIYQFVDEDKRAWHAGVSEWKGQKDINSHSIGIELVNEGEFADYPEFAEAQIESLIALCRDIQARHNIGAGEVIGHDDIAPGRKKDPGPSFPWGHLRTALIGETQDD